MPPLTESTMSFSPRCVSKYIRPSIPLSASLLHWEAAHSFNRPVLKLKGVLLKQRLGLLNTRGDSINLEVCSFREAITFKQYVLHQTNREYGNIAADPLSLIPNHRMRS